MPAGSFRIRVQLSKTARHVPDFAAIFSRSLFGFFAHDESRAFSPALVLSDYFQISLLACSSSNTLLYGATLFALASSQLLLVGGET
jgi:hypothetical protein